MEKIRSFIRLTKWNNSDFKLLQGDASPRKYYRVCDSSSSALIMDARFCKEIIRPFIEISNYLRIYGFSSPEIYEVDLTEGFVLIEDFGDTTLYRSLRYSSSEIEKLYELVINLLLDFSSISYNKLCPFYNEDFLFKELSYFTDYYLKFMNIELTGEQINAFNKSWEKPFLLLKSCTITPTFVHKDFHGGNLMLLPSRKGTSSVGIIDFQNAKFGNQVYDFISFFYDCRNPISNEFRLRAENLYIIKSGINRDTFDSLKKIFIVHRNIKILGNFTKVYLTQSNPYYLRYLSNTWTLINNDISIEFFDELKNWLNNNIA